MRLSQISSRFLRVALMASLVALVAGCGTALRIAYNNSDVAVRYLAHEYFDLHNDQSEAFKVQLARFHAWHRSEELPKYATLLDNAAGRVQHGLAPGDVTWAIASVRERAKALTGQAVADAAPVMTMLGPDNVAALERKLESNNAKFAKQFASGNERKDERARAKRVRERIEEWTGSLTPEQESLVDAYVASIPRLTEAQLEDRKRRQQELVSIFETYRGKPELATKVRAFMLDWEAERGPEYKRLAAEQEARFVQLMVDLDRTLTPKQRTTAVERLRRNAQELRALADEGRRRDAPVRAGEPEGARS
jgi:hypothetical protein